MYSFVFSQVAAHTMHDGPKEEIMVWNQWSQVNREKGKALWVSSGTMRGSVLQISKVFRWAEISLMAGFQCCFCFLLDNRNFRTSLTLTRMYSCVVSITESNEDTFLLMGLLQ